MPLWAGALVLLPLEKKISAKALVLVDMAPRIEQEGQQQIQDFKDQCPDGFDSLEQVAGGVRIISGRF